MTPLLDEPTFRRIAALATKKSWLKKRDRQLISLLGECLNNNEVDLLFDLLSSWQYVTSSDLEDATQQIAQTICTTWNLSASNTLITAIADSGKPDGSQALVQALKHQLPGTQGWKEKNFRNSLTSSLKLRRRNIVLVDDFTGTGRKISRKVRWYRRKLATANRTTNLHFCSLACMNISTPVLNQLNIPYYSPIWLARGITDRYNGLARSQAMNNMRRLETLLHSLPSNYALGYEQSEALYAQEAHGVPNNVFPIFWWEQSYKRKFRTTLFKRAFEQ